MIKIYSHLFFLFFSWSVLAQPAGNTQIQFYTTENGLPSNGIKGLQWDEKTDFLWLATEAGIVRFNGAEFKSYTKENMPSIASERMLFMLRNNAGKFYVSDLPGNIFSINRNKPELWKNNPEQRNPYFSNYYMLAVSDSLFLMHINDSLLNQFSAVTDKIVCTSDTSFLILNQGTIFFQSASLKTPVALPLEHRNYSALFKIDESYFITDINKQTFLINIQNYSLTPVPVVLENSGIKLIPETKNSFLYWQTGMPNPIFIDGSKAWLFNYADNRITARLIFNEIPADAFIRSIQYSEKNGTLFIGTDSKGLIVLNKKRVETKKRISPGPGNRNSYYAQIELSNGNILTNEGDIIGDEPVNDIEIPIKSKFTFSISITNDSLLWYVPTNSKEGRNMLNRYDLKLKSRKIFDKITGETIVRTIGQKTFLANINGIGILENDSMRFLVTYPKNSGSNITFDVAEINPGILALATSAGLFTFNTLTNKFDTLYRIKDVWIRSISKYKDYLFFGTYGAGFYIYKNGIVKPMPLDKKKYLLYTHCFVQDENGFCWISTNRGLFKANTTELINAFENKNSPVYYHYFGKKDGMEMTEMNGGCTPCAIHLKNKIISFPTMDGLLWVNPEKANPVLPAGEIFVDEILVDNKIFNPDSIEMKDLPANTGEIVIKLALPAWSNTENIYLDYQLNDTTNWKPVEIEKGFELKFNNLLPGKYILRIRKHNGFGPANYSYKEIKFYITIPWYKKIWFNFLALLVTAGLILLYVNFRTSQYRKNQLRLENLVSEKTKELQQKNEALEKNNSIKTRLISIISHDIVTPLKFLTAAGKNLIDKRKIMTEDLQDETIMEMANTSQELQLLSTNILNWIKYQNENRRLVKEHFNLYEITNQVFSVLYSIARQKRISLVNDIEKEKMIYQYFEPLKILIYNLVSNAINFSESGKITVSCKTENLPAGRQGSKIIISVKDEGVGMTPEQIKNILADQFIISSANIDNRKGNGLGYLIIKDLLKTMEGSLNIISEKTRPDEPAVRGKGTEVLISVTSV